MLSVGTIIGGTFGFARRNLPIIAVWCVVHMVCGVIMSLLLRPMFESQLDAMASTPPHLPEGLFGYLALIYLIFGAMFLVLFAAAFRAVLRPEQSRAAYMRLGMDELRLFALALLFFIGLWMAAIVAGVAAAIIGVLLALLIGKSALLALALCLYLGAMGGMIYLIVRFSLAAPLTIFHGRIALAESWKLTKGRFWTLFGAYICIVLIVALPLLIIMSVMAGGYYHQFAVAPYDPAAFSTAMREQLALQAPGRLLWFVGVIGGGIVGGISIALQGAMTAIASRKLLAESEAL